MTTDDPLTTEAERGYCTEHLGGGKYCLRPAVAEIGPPERPGLLCEQHVLGWPDSVITWLDAPL